MAQKFDGGAEARGLTPTGRRRRRGRRERGREKEGERIKEEQKKKEEVKEVGEKTPYRASRKAGRKKTRETKRAG